jgi:hypothetical protein
MPREDTQFAKGREKSGGRQKGTANRSTIEGRDFARRLMDDPAYRERLRERLLAGKVHPGVETMLWAYGYGKPKDHLELSAAIGNDKAIAEMSTDELLAELQAHHRETGQFLAAQRHARAGRLRGNAAS